MKRSKVQKNIRKNLPSYDEVKVDSAAVFAKILGRIFAVVIAAALPIGLLLAGYSLAFKLPDIYSFDLSRTMSTEKIGYEDDSALISNLMSDYMNHKTDAFILRAKSDGRETSIFTQNDARAMKSFRDNLDVAFMIACICLPLSAVGYLLMYLLGRKRALKYAIRASLIIFLGAIIAASSIVLIRSNAAAFTRDFIGISYAKEDILPRVFGAGLRVEMSAVAFAAAAIGMVLVYALTAHLTKGDKMFKKED